MSVVNQKWRVGRKVGRTVYCEAEGTEGYLIGAFDSRESACLAAAAPQMYGTLRLAVDALEELLADVPPNRLRIAVGEFLAELDIGLRDARVKDARERAARDKAMGAP